MVLAQMKARAKKSTIAFGKKAKLQVYRGKKLKTSGGITREGLMKNKHGKVVSKRRSANGRLRFKRIEGWNESLMRARQMLHITGFVAINGRSWHGQALYMKTRQLVMARKQSAATAASPARKGDASSSSKA
eukprot:NODE_16558_length_988_cov_3.472706.p2 GENE.NODE_16558_length_988_cov_3.472706~~NODE_16558_length_988_cov_3.472706.p2  ORF type:complete len:132 (+),score=27.80 NODE_16558_length_988_cov_3.472706:78-473(+)